MGIITLVFLNFKIYLKIILLDLGKTIREDISDRVNEHFNDKRGASDWTRMHKPKYWLAPITNISNDLESWERAETLERWVFLF